MEKRLFYKDPSTGIEAPLLIFQDDLDAIHDVSVSKQDKIDPSINSDSHEVVKTINDLYFRAQHTMKDVEIPGEYKQVLTLDASGNYTWEDKEENMSVFEIQTTQNPWKVGTIDFGTFDERDFMSFLIKTPNCYNAASCSINGEPVTMNHEPVSAGVIAPDKLYLCTHENEEAKFDFVEIHNLTTIVHNLTTNLMLQDSSDFNIETYSREYLNTFYEGIQNYIDDTKVLLGDVSVYDPWSVYVKDDYVLHDGSVYRCNVEKVNGIWNPNQWAETDMMNEIFELRGSHPIYTEVVTVKAFFDSPHSSYAGDASVTISYDASTGRESRTYDLSTGNNYTIQFFVEYGYNYYVQGAPVAGYTTPTQISNKAKQTRRTVKLLYKPTGSGVYIIDENGVETDYTAWNPVNNAQAKYVELTNSALCPGGTDSDNSIVISKTWNSQTFQGAYCLEGIGFPSLDNIASATTAALDYDGYLNSSLAYHDCSVLDASGYSFVDRYNQAHAEDPEWVDVNIDQYLPTITTAWTKTETFNGKTLKGYVPAYGQLKQIINNFADINAALNLIGSQQLTLSGGWWSSTEYSDANMNGTSNKSDSNFAKTGTYNILVLMDLFRQ